ncbi:MAG: cytochrome c oxidase subunit II [Actinobacteria bacterium]|nr:cytochrome c oxidase subunit II [Actinomycetota bacterium]
MSAVVASSLALTGCSLSGTLAPRGPDAQIAANIWWYMLWLSAAIFVGWLALFVVAMVRRPTGEIDEEHEQRLHRRFIVGGGIVLPSIAFASLFVIDLLGIAALPQGDEVVVDAVGYQFWWEFAYEHPELVTANELYIPTDTDVQVRLRTEDVIHSFWVPQLSGKRDMVPGRTNVLTLHATEPGRYLGECTEFCGVQHANMRFEVVAVPPDEYQQWLDDMVAPAAEPQTEDQRRGYDAFMTASCAACHVIRGTPADGRAGPDLTHFAQRRWLGAGAAPNDRGHLGGWVVNPQSIKPGSTMPPVELDAEDLPVLLDYLESLE